MEDGLYSEKRIVVLPLLLNEKASFACIHQSPLKQEEEFAAKKIKAYLRKRHQTWRHR